MKRSLVFRELAIRRMPGFPGGGPRLENLSPGINLIHGPNASGKTTAALALQGLLWPRTAPEQAGLVGRFRVGDDDWHVDVESRRASWQRAGHDSAPPPLPPGDDRERYLLSLHGLLRADDRALADRIRIESAGGYDVSAAAAALDFGARGRPVSLLAQLAAAREDLDQARAGEAELREDQVRLERLRHDLATLEVEAGRLQLLNSALDLARARERLADAERAVAAFPPGVWRLRGNELERLDEWSADRERLDRLVAEADADVARAAAILEEVGLGDSGVPISLLGELEERLEAIRQLDDEIARARNSLGRARGRREQAGAALGVGPTTQPMPDPSVADVQRLDRFAQVAGSLRERRQALESRIRALTTDDAATVSRAAEVIPLLRRWLRAGGGDRGAVRRLWRLVNGAVAGLGLAGLALIVAGALVGPVWSAGAGVILVLLAAALFLSRPAQEIDPRGDLQREARRLGHEPDAWTTEGVEFLLDTLERLVAGETLAAEQKREAIRLQDELRQVAIEDAELETERAELASSLGLEPAPEPLPLHAMATLLRLWNEARLEEAAAEALLQDLMDRKAVAISAAAGSLAPYGHQPTDGETVAGALRDLRERRDRHQSATGELQAARLQGHRARDEIQSLEQRRISLFRALELTPAEEPILRNWAGQLEEVQRARTDLEQAERQEAAAAAAVEAQTTSGREPASTFDAVTDAITDAITEAGHRDGQERDRHGVTVADLERAVERAREAAESVRQLESVIAGIEARISVARRKHDVEEALAAVTEATADLAERRDRDVEAEIGAALVGWLAEHDRDRNRPRVFHRARELFRLITRGRYRLDMQQGDDAAFRAYDTTTQRGHGLEELSSGTRLQLLLAVRLAFVETQEAGASLPLLLDEVLANCDDDRAAAIIDAAIAVARDGRQIFYFTAQADELVKWRTRLEGQDQDPDAERVDWCVRRITHPGAGGALADIDWDPTPGDQLPESAALDHPAYGRALNVPPFDPWADGVGGLHLWYLVDDVDALHQLLAMGVTSWGQLEHLLEMAGNCVLPGVARDALEQARLAARICDRFRQLWRQGRGRPVDRSVLAESGAVSDNFIDQVAALCHELEGQAEALMDALVQRRVPRFQAGKTEELRTFLQAHGYLSEEEPLTQAHIRIRLLAETGADPGLDVDLLITRLVQGA